MKIYFNLPKTESRSLDRVNEALIRYKPENIKIVHKVSDADMVIRHVVGRQDREKRGIETIKLPYCVIQYCLRSTLRPSTEGWLPIWRNAKLVWSFLDLKRSCQEDGVPDDFSFHHSPLGCDATVFQPTNQGRKYLIAANSSSYLTESAKEIVLATQRVRKRMFFLGNELNKHNVVCLNNISDSILAGRFSQSLFVSGLRRKEGFELPALEGLLCGARPIFFDRSHYRKWFSDWGIFIPEGPREEVINSLETIFRKEPWIVSQAEIEVVRQRFDWEPIIGEFWERCLN